MAEEAITEEDIERVKEGLRLFSAGQFDALEELMAPDVVVERVGGLPPVKGWQAAKEFFKPDAFASQTIEPLSMEAHDDRLLIHVRILSVGATSGVELETIGWLVFTEADGVVGRIAAFTDEGPARAAAGLT